MAKTLEIPQLTGVSCTAKLFSVGSDTVVETIALTEATNRLSIGTGVIASATGWNRAIVFDGSTPCGYFVVYVGSTDPATYQAVEDSAVDWAKIQNPTTTVGFSGTTIATSQVVASVSGAVGSVTGLTASILDATISSRMATYTQPTGFLLSATFPSGTIANTTNITTATGITVATNNDKTGYSLSVTPPTAAAIATTVWTDLLAGSDFSTSSSIGKLLKDDIDATISSRLATAGYTAPTNLTAAQIATGVWTDTTAGDFTVSSSIGKSVLNGVALGTGLTINGYTGNTPQTGDSFARIGAAGAGSTALGDTRIAYLDVAVTSRMATYTQPTGFLAATFPSAVGDATAASQTTILARLGSWTGSGINTVLGAFRALMGKAAALTPTDISSGTTFDNTTDSVEALRDNLLAPTIAGRTLDVSETGEAGIDWGNVGSPTTTVGLTNTTIKTATDVESHFGPIIES